MQHPAAVLKHLTGGGCYCAAATGNAVFVNASGADCNRSSKMHLQTTTVIFCMFSSAEKFCKGAMGKEGAATVSS